MEARPRSGCRLEKCGESGEYQLRQFFIPGFSLEPQIVTGAFDGHEFCPGGNQLERAFEFSDGAEGIASTVNEKGRSAETG